MIHIYGDSHADRSFRNLKLPHKNYFMPSITMFRIGRDNAIINFNNKIHDENSIICISYGEVDCRCHIRRQIDLGRDEDDVIRGLVSDYFKTLANNIKIYKNVIIVGVIPPRSQSKFERIHGRITHEFPFVGTDQDRVRYTQKVNRLLEEQCTLQGYVYFNPYQHYADIDGTLKESMSDKNVHLGDNSFFMEKFMELL